MWLSSNILSKMVDISDIEPQQLALRLTMSTAEIDGIDYLNRHLDTVISARILDVKPHPDADKLTLVEVDTGANRLRVVCGAKNHKKGDIVPLAMVGTRFSQDFVISKSKIRGEESEGMLCSKRELGLSDDHSGIMILREDTKLGVPMSRLFPEWRDVRFEIDNKSITHRPDLWSHLGFAREIGAILGRPVQDPVNHSLAETFRNKEELEIHIENSDACPRYSALMVGNIVIKESPEWLKAMVTSIGMRPINNIVDITNYVMAELGEPMHAFDHSKLKGRKIIVRMAKKGEELTTLDGQKHTLMEEDIVIADESGAIALAGVMGGGNSEIDDSTTTIVLEAASFNPVNIRKTAARYGNRTEAAMRFEKSLSPELTTSALLRCFELIKQCLPEARALTEIVDSYPKKLESVKISISTDMIRKQLGEDISDERIIGILTSLSFDVTVHGTDLTIWVPHYRATKDISIPADIVEEVGRIYGYDNITPRAPMVPCLPPAHNDLRLFERTVKRILSEDRGLTEVSGYSFVGEETLNRLEMNLERELRLRNPLSRDYDRLNRSLVPNIVKNIEFNQRYHESFGIYEMNRVYHKESRTSADLIAEERRITGAVYARRPEGPVFYSGKTIVSGLLKS
jgi:phenylalanyl-tRNA synthetase beta chain